MNYAAYRSLLSKGPSDSFSVAYEHVQKYFESNLRQSDSAAVAAYQYACNRWGTAFVEDSGIGFAYDAWDGLIRYAQSHSLSLDLLKTMGLIKHADDSQRDYDFFRNRIKTHPTEFGRQPTTLGEIRLSATQ